MRKFINHTLFEFLFLCTVLSAIFVFPILKICNREYVPIVGICWVAAFGGSLLGAVVYETWYAQPPSLKGILQGKCVRQHTVFLWTPMEILGDRRWWCTVTYTEIYMIRYRTPGDINTAYGQWTPQRFLRNPAD